MKTIKILAWLLSIHAYAFSQLNASGSQYYLNPYLANPAFAGQSIGFETNMAYKAQWTAIPDAPSLQSLTCTYGTERKIGLGLMVLHETFGVFDRSGIKLSYAYHLPMNDEDTFLDFGISGVLKNNSINFSKVIAEDNDQTILNYNQKPWSADGDVGMTLRTNRFIFGASLIDLRQFVRKDIGFFADQPGISLSIRASFESNDIKYTPLLQYRFVHYFRDVYDAGLQGSFAGGKLLGSMVYHSTNSITFSIGTDYMERLKLVAFYTSGTSELQQYSNGEFEFAMQFRW